MKRLQIYIEPAMDEALEFEAARTGTSKAAIIRRLIAEHSGPGETPDPVDELVGTFKDQPGAVDDIVYAAEARPQ